MSDTNFLSRQMLSTRGRLAASDSDPDLKGFGGSLRLRWTIAASWGNLWILQSARNNRFLGGKQSKAARWTTIKGVREYFGTEVTHLEIAYVPEVSEYQPLWQQADLDNQEPELYAIRFEGKRASYASKVLQNRREPRILGRLGRFLHGEAREASAEPFMA